MNDQRELAAGTRLLAPAFFALFPSRSATSPTLTNSPILPCLFQVLFVALRSEGRSFWVSPLANYVNVKQVTFCILLIFHLQSGMTANLHSRRYYFMKKNMYIKHLRYSKCLITALNKQLWGPSSEMKWLPSPMARNDSEISQVDKCAWIWAGLGHYKVFCSKTLTQFFWL